MHFRKYINGLLILILGVMTAGFLRGGLSTSGQHVPDPTPPTPYRTTTQTMVAGNKSNSARGSIPQLGSEFSISVWVRTINTLGGVVWNFYDPAAPSGSASFGGSTFQGMALDYGGITPAVINSQNLFTLTGTDQAGNHIASGTVTGGGSNVTAFGYITTETTVNNGQYSMLLTVQVRAGNVELWATYRGMTPRLLIQHAATWTGTSGPLPFWIGGGNYSSTCGAPPAICGAIEFEMPLVLPDRSLSTNEIAQLADAINPNGIATSSLATAAMRFSSITSGGTSASDTVVPTNPTDGQTITLNGSVYTFKTSPVAGTDIQIVPDLVVASPSFSTSTGIITASNNNLVNGQRVSIRRSAVIGVDVDFLYYVVNSIPSTSFQIAQSPGGTPVVPSFGGSGTLTASGVPATLNNLATALNALTPNTGGASNATYVQAMSDTLFIKARTAGSVSFAFSTTSTARLPATPSLSLGWAIVTDYTGFNVGLLGSPGAERQRGQIWSAPLGTYLAPNTAVIGSVLLQSWTEGTVSQHLGGVGYLSLSGIYTGNAPTGGVQFQFLNQSGGATIQSYAPLTSFTYDGTAKTWSGKITVPKGKRWLANQSKKSGNTQVTQTSEVKHGVGEIIIMMGRSITARFPSLMDALAVMPNGFISRFVGTGTILGSTSGNLPVDNTWHVFNTNDPNSLVLKTTSGAGEAVFANMISTASDAVVGLDNRSVGGETFAELTTPAVFNAYLADLTNSFTDTSIAPLVSTYYWEHTQELTSYYTLLDELYTLVTQYFGSQTALAVSTGSIFWNSIDGTTLLAINRVDQTTWLQSPLAGSHSVAPAVWDASRIIDAGDPTFFWSNDPKQITTACSAGNRGAADGVHPCRYSDLQVFGNIIALSFLNHAGVIANSGVGPTPVSATRSGANIDVTFNLNGATGMQTLNVGDVSGFDVILASNSFIPPSANVTANASTDVISWTGTPVANGDTMLISSVDGVGGVPAGLTSGTTYYAINKTTNNFQLSATSGGSAIDFTTAGTNVIATDTAALLPISSVTITGANTVRIVLASAPGAPVAVNLNWGRPGRQASEPMVTTQARAAMANWLVNNSIGNALVDNFALTYADGHTLGRPARMTPVPLVTNWLLQRDLNPASNDNSPMWLEKAA